MTVDFEDPAPPPAPPAPAPAPRRFGGFNPRLTLVSFAVASFVLGGACFGWLFLTNWKLLQQLHTADVRLPHGPAIQVPARPEIGALPQPRPSGVASKPA